MEENKRVVVGETTVPIPWKKVRSGYRAVQSLTKIIDNITLRYLIFSFSGPLSSIPLHHVFGGNPFRWLYSWPFKTWIPPFCNGERIISRNIFERVPFRMEKKGESSRDEDEKRITIEVGREKIFEYTDECTSSVVSAITGGENCVIRRNKFVTSGIYKGDELIDRAPSKNSIIVDNKCMSLSTRWTHYFYCHLIQVDMYTFFQNSLDNDLFSEMEESISEEIYEYSLDFQYWLWEVTGRRESLRYDIISYFSSDLSKNVEVIPFEKALWISREGDSKIVKEYLELKKEKKGCGEGLIVSEFLKIHPHLKDVLPSWYYLHIGASTLEDVKYNQDNVTSALRCERVDYAEMFLKRGDMKGFDWIILERNNVDEKYLPLIMKYVPVPRLSSEKYQGTGTYIPHSLLWVRRILGDVLGEYGCKVAEHDLYRIALSNTVYLDSIKIFIESFLHSPDSLESLLPQKNIHNEDECIASIVSRVFILTSIVEMLQKSVNVIPLISLLKDLSLLGSSIALLPKCKTKKSKSLWMDGMYIGIIELLKVDLSKCSSSDENIAQLRTFLLHSDNKEEIRCIRMFVPIC